MIKEEQNMAAEIEGLNREITLLKQERSATNIQAMDEVETWGKALAELEAVIADLAKSNDSLKAELKDYKSRCQAWADRTLARDEYTQFLERHVAAFVKIMEIAVDGRYEDVGDACYSTLAAYKAEWEMRGKKPNEEASQVV